MRRRRLTLVARGIAISIVVVLAIGVTSTGPADAHADLIGSDPADGAVLDAPVEEIVIRFTAAVSPRESQIRLLDGDGNVLETTVLQRTADAIVVQPVTPLADGRFALMWAADSADGHAVEGAVGFEVSTVGGDALATTDALAEDTSSAADRPTTDVDEPIPTTTIPRVTAVDPVQPTTEAPAVEAASEASSDAANDRLGDVAGAIGRWTSLTGILVAIGATAFAATAFTGTVPEIRRIVGWIRAGGIAVVAGTAIEILAIAVSTGGWGVLTDPVGLLDAIPTSLAYAAVLRFAGGIALLQNPTLVTTSVGEPTPVPVGHAAGIAADEADPATTARHRLVVREEWLIIAGLLAVAVSYLLDGHSVDLGPAARVANAVHVVAGGIWLGGVVVLADVVIRRRRSGFPTHVAETVVRFSRIATAALVAVAFAGGALAWSIVDEPSDLLSGTWGRLLLGKVLLVAIAAGFGAYNHFTLVPRLDRQPTEGDVAGLSRSLTFEAIALLLVVAATALLVASAP